ncbi:MAG: pyridine nucleotide-disulfide oxidoreductase, partial [Proteobacteria bacterium]
LVSFSALLTCRHAGIRPAAMIEEGGRPTAWNVSRLLPLLQGVELRLGTRLRAIIGKRRVEAVEIVGADGEIDTVLCDGVVFSGRFLPEATLARMAHLDVDPLSGGPRVDAFGRCSDAVYFATGNLLRPVETAGWCWDEGRRAARAIRGSLDGSLPDTARSVDIVPNHPIIKYVVPQRLDADGDDHTLQIRVREPARGTLSFGSPDGTILNKRINTLPERRLLVNLATPAGGLGSGPVCVDFKPS